MSEILEREMKMITLIYQQVWGQNTQRERLQFLKKKTTTEYYCKFFVKLQNHELYILFRW